MVRNNTYVLLIGEQDANNMAKKSSITKKSNKKLLTKQGCNANCNT